MLKIKSLDLNLFLDGDAKRHANQIAAKYMSSEIDATSLLNGLSAFAAFIAIFAWGVTVDTLWIKICMGIFVQTWLGFICFNITHELAHDIVFKRRPKYQRLNSIIGCVIGAVTFTPYVGFKETHLEHHKNTNDPAHDPNYWVLRGNVLWVAIKLGLAMFYDYFAMNKYSRDQDKPEITRYFILFCTSLILVAGVLSYLVGFANVFLLWLLPAYLSFSLVFLAVAVIPHKQSPDAPDAQVMKIIILPGIAQAISTFLHAGHNYHLLHHMYPRVPSHHYAQMSRELFLIQEQSLSQNLSA